jgi:hypothetical protein
VFLRFVIYGTSLWLAPVVLVPSPLNEAHAKHAFEKKKQLTVLIFIKPNDQRIPCLCGEDSQYVIDEWRGSTSNNHGKETRIVRMKRISNHGKETRMVRMKRISLTCLLIPDVRDYFVWLWWSQSWK